jgi:electron transfer flavoprotein alpha subunit
MKNVRRWNARSRLLVTLELAVALPASALIVVSVLHLKSIQRDRSVEAAIQREARPWFLAMDSGCQAAWMTTGATGAANVERISVSLPAEAKRTAFGGVRVPNADAQTIRPDAKLLFVAGAGWSKKQADGKTHLPEAEAIILEFLRKSGASLGGSKSLVDQTGENQAVLGFMTHLNQVGQTGATPRHPKGLATCCHGEEPHVVGWRFIQERRAVNLDPNCGWARGKADVLYVADAFEAMTAARPYRMRPLTSEQALAELRKYAGIQFDPVVLDAFARTDWVAGVPDPRLPSLTPPMASPQRGTAMRRSPGRRRRKGSVRLGRPRPDRRPR